MSDWKKGKQMKLNKLTPEQEAKIPIYVEEALKEGHRTKTIDREAAAESVKSLCAIAEIKDPIVLFFDSPLACQLARCILKSLGGSKLNYQLRSQLGSQLSPLRSQLDSHLDQLESQFISQFVRQIDFGLDSQLYFQLGSQLYSQLDSQIDQLESQFISQFARQIDFGLDSQLGSQLYSKLDSQLSQLASQFYSKLGSQLSQLRSQFYFQLARQLRSQLSQLDSQLYSQLRSQLSQLGSQLDSKLGSQLSQLASQLYSQLETDYNSQWYSPLYWAGYYTYYKFIRNELFPERAGEFPLLDVVLNTQKNLHYVENLGPIIFVSDFPEEIHKVNGQLHKDLSPAIKYRDGFGVYVLKGVVVPEWIVTTPGDDLNPIEVMKIENAEHRLLAISKLNPEKMLAGLSGKVISEKGDEYALYEVTIEGSPEKLLKMKNPSEEKIHYEWVEPHIKTVNEALAWRRGIEIFSEPVFKT